MKIRKISIEHFRSLKSVSMEDITDLTVLIGTNSSGKSNLLEALTVFFDNLDPAPERKLGAIDHYNWFDRNDDEPIIFSIDIQLKREEMEKMGFKKGTTIVKDMNELNIVRSIQGPYTSATWKTSMMKVNGLDLASTVILADPDKWVKQNMFRRWGITFYFLILQLFFAVINTFGVIITCLIARGLI